MDFDEALDGMFNDMDHDSQLSQLTSSELASSQLTSSQYPTIVVLPALHTQQAWTRLDPPA